MPIANSHPINVFTAQGVFLLKGFLARGLRSGCRCLVRLQLQFRTKILKKKLGPSSKAKERVEKDKHAITITEAMENSANWQDLSGDFEK